MELSQITLFLFTAFSSLRIFSYGPQIAKIAADRDGATAISYATWGLWTAGNLTTAVYAAVNLRDWYLSIVSVIYAVCCLVVIALTVLKRRRAAVRTSQQPAANAKRDVLVQAVRREVNGAACTLLKGARPACSFEADLAAAAKGLFWFDVKNTFDPRTAWKSE